MLGRSLSAAQLPPTGPCAEQPVARSRVSFLPPSRRSARDARPPARMDHSTAAQPARAPGPSFLLNGRALSAVDGWLLIWSP
jgi:hypothetical protein